MKFYDKTWLKLDVARDRLRIAKYGACDLRTDYGRDPYFDRCRGFHQLSGTMMIFTRDQGHHTSGWWKNPDYERCYHLSLSFSDPSTREPIGRDKPLSREWVGLFFGDDRKSLWCEPPYSQTGRIRDVWHYRLFCAPNWTPILPRGEVYNREFTESGWKSYSDVEADMAEAEREWLLRKED